jgi:hypothetical protein
MESVSLSSTSVSEDTNFNEIGFGDWFMLSLATSSCERGFPFIVSLYT